MSGLAEREIWHGYLWHGFDRIQHCLNDPDEKSREKNYPACFSIVSDRL